ncbi:hypothetical protein TRIP_C20152 [Candidatus Zixiibacteriota bacterium]|nr:hypothetical protein TRIP_C20152 [candidate division Zixibacteria bacterium]
MKNQVILKKFRVDAVYIIIVLTMLLFTRGWCASQIFFIYGQPCFEKPGHIPYPVTIFNFNESTKSLDSLWSPEFRSMAWSIDVYSNEGYIIISDGNSYPSRVQIMPMSSFSQSSVLNTSDLKGISNYYFFPEETAPGSLLVSHLTNQTISTGGNPFIGTAYHFDAKGAIQKSASIPSGDNVRLAGPNSPYSGGGRGDVISFRTLSDIPARPVGIDLSFSGPPVPDSIVQSKQSYGWVMIANQPRFRVFMSVPERNGLDQRELLIYRVDSGVWKSLMISGAETSPKLIDGWLAGVIADSDPETDFTIRKAFPSIPREDVVLINPMENREFEIHLGPSSEVLWIEGNEVYYRMGEGLYKATIQNDDFVNRSLLIKDTIVNGIHWAFRGSMGSTGN